MKRWKVFVIACSADASTRRPVDQLGKFVTGGAVDRPILPQRFVARQNLFDHEVNGAPILRERSAQRFGATALQFLEILFRQIESVRMIDPHAGDRARADQFEQQPMRRIEDLGQLHPDRGEIVDVEETAVVDFLRSHAPESEAIGLIVQQRDRARSKLRGSPGVPLICASASVDRCLHLRRFLATPLQPSLDDFLFAGAFGDSLRDRFPSGAADIRAR